MAACRLPGDMALSSSMFAATNMGALVASSTSEGSELETSSRENSDLAAVGFRMLLESSANVGRPGGGGEPVAGVAGAGCPGIPGGALFPFWGDVVTWLGGGGSPAPPPPPPPPPLPLPPELVNEITEG